MKECVHSRKTGYLIIFGHTNYITTFHKTSPFIIAITQISQGSYKMWKKNYLGTPYSVKIKNYKTVRLQ